MFCSTQVHAHTQAHPHTNTPTHTHRHTHTQAMNQWLGRTGLDVEPSGDIWSHLEAFRAIWDIWTLEATMSHPGGTQETKAFGGQISENVTLSRTEYKSSFKVSISRRFFNGTIDYALIFTHLLRSRQTFSLRHTARTPRYISLGNILRHSMKNQARMGHLMTSGDRSGNDFWRWPKTLEDLC